MVPAYVAQAQAGICRDNTLGITLGRRSSSNNRATGTADEKLASVVGVLA
jgi:hypothetical protein